MQQRGLWSPAFWALRQQALAQATSSGPTARIYVPAIAANGGTGNNITLNGTTNITGTASNAVTQPFTDASARIATDAYVQSVQQVTRSTVYLNGVTGGTLSFASLGTGAAFSFTATGEVITSINSVFAGGSGYKVGDRDLHHEGQRRQLHPGDWRKRHRRYDGSNPQRRHRQHQRPRCVRDGGD